MLRNIPVCSSATLVNPVLVTLADVLRGDAGCKTLANRMDADRDEARDVVLKASRSY